MCKSERASQSEDVPIRNELMVLDETANRSGPCGAGAARVNHGLSEDLRCEASQHVAGVQPGRCTPCYVDAGPARGRAPATTSPFRRED